MTKILVIEDEAALQNFLSRELMFEGYEVIQATTGLDGWAAWQNDAQIAVILLDWMLPELDGLSLLKRIRTTSNVPIIFMTARDYVSDKVIGLDQGADDYVTKPFEIEELFARIRLVLRKQKKAVDQITVGNVHVNRATHEVIYQAQRINLTTREVTLLFYLMQNFQQVVTRDEILTNVWQDNYDNQPNIIDVYIRFLRNKLVTLPLVIETVRGVGYRMAGATHESNPEN
ncbi:response regulator transcription factor [Weissella soli]|jgi:DNA-binding response OmpR family regulator|uniref:response regulator transcription factor n=1 Tax=Weissella soli TaxID=155866 RepID=UPI001FA9BFB9|nr:response regulator transcription factor [Weissella soli]